LRLLGDGEFSGGCGTVNVEEEGREERVSDEREEGKEEEGEMSDMTLEAEEEEGGTNEEDTTKDVELVVFSAMNFQLKSSRKGK
jgi:hypothetical protein